MNQLKNNLGTNCAVLSSVYNGSQKKGGNDTGCHGQKKLHGILGLGHYLLSVYYEPDTERESQL